MKCIVTGKCTACGWYHHATETSLATANGITAHVIKPYLYARCINCKSVMPWKWTGENRSAYEETMKKQDEEDTRTLQGTITGVLMGSEETCVQLMLDAEGRNVSVELPRFRGSEQARAFYTHIEKNI